MDILAMIFLSTFVEGFVKYLFDVFSGKLDDVATVNTNFVQRLKPYTHFVALALGVGVAIAYKVDIPHMFGLATDYGMVNYIISGVAIGRGSNYLNDLISMTKEKPDTRG